MKDDLEDLKRRLVVGHKVSGKPAAYFPDAMLFPRMPASTTTVRRTKWNSNGDDGDWVRQSGASC
jgi:hypothetical protein